VEITGYGAAGFRSQRLGIRATIGLTTGRCLLSFLNSSVAKDVVKCNMQTRFVQGVLGVISILQFATEAVNADPSVLNTNLQIRLVLYTTDTSGANSIRIRKDPRNNQLYYLKYNGDIHSLNLQPGDASSSTLAYSASDHGISSGALGMTIGPDGIMYVVGNTSTNQGNSTFVKIMKGVPDRTGGRVWSLLARTEPYPLSRTAFDHRSSGIVVSPDNQFIYLNCGSRTDHGEVEDTGGLYPDLRETGLTAKVLRIPVTASNLVLPNDLSALRSAGYIYAEGTRNAFDLRVAPNGDLFAIDNGPDRDMSDELNWLQAGLHYGFPWRMGGADNPQQFPEYNPTNDLLLDPRFIAVADGYYHNDPTFPPPPTNFAEPVINLGPDADSYRDPIDGSIKIASALGLTLSTVTAHRSPLGLVFDTAGAMAPPFQGHGFMLGFTPGDPTGDSVPGPFMDPGQDMVDLQLTKLGTTNYQAQVTRIAGGFTTPIDAEIISNRIYVIEYSGNQGIWEITFPPSLGSITITQPSWQAAGFRFLVNGAVGQTYSVEMSTNLTSWVTLTNVLATTNPFQIVDATAGNTPSRFYRVSLP